MGLDSRSNYSWGSLTSLKKTAKEEFTRLLMDCADVTFSKKSRVFSPGKIIGVSKISKESIVELADLQGVPKELTWESYLPLIDYSGREYSLDELISYVLGLQEHAKEVFPNKVRFYASSRIDPLKIAKMLVQWGIKNKLKLKPIIGARSIFIISRALVSLCQTYESLIPPPQIRSNFKCLISFMAGVLDSSLRINRNQDPPFYLQIDIQKPSVLAFYLNVLRLVGITPRKLHILKLDESPWCANLFLNEKDTDIMKAFESATESRRAARCYSMVKEVLPFAERGFLLSVDSEDEHWSPLVNVVPMHCFS